MRLPLGYSQLREGLGDLVREKRKERRIKQEGLAHDIGIRREALSRIEKGRQTPGPRALDALMAELDIEWDQIAHVGVAAKPARAFEDGTRGRALAALGQEIYRRRKEEGLSLRALGGLLGISSAQLSRLERGQVIYSRFFKDREGHLVFEREDRQIDIADDALEAFVEGRLDEYLADRAIVAECVSC